MKICIFSNLYHPNIIGGAERSAQLLAEGLLKAGFLPFVVTIADRDYVDEINGVKVYYVFHTNLFWKYTAARHGKVERLIWHTVDVFNVFILQRIQKIIEQEKPDIAHTNNIAGFSVAVWKLLHEHNIPIAHTLRDYYLLCVNSSMFRNNRNCLTPCGICRTFTAPKKKATDYVGAAVGVSHSILHRHLNLGYFANTRIKTTVYNAIPDAPGKEKSKRGDKIHFGYMGILAPHKGVELILKVLSGIEGAELFLYGTSITPRYDDYLRGRFPHSNVRFMGFRSTEEALANIDVSLVPSIWYEPFSRVIVESYSYGIPVIASSRGGPVEIVEEGKTGFLFSPDKEEDLAAIVRGILARPESLGAMKDNCLRKSKEFSLDNHIEQYARIYRGLLSGGPLPS